MNETISNQVVAHKVVDYLKEKTEIFFSPRPLSYYHPREGTWFIVPSAQWPAYRYGKIILYGAGDAFHVGIYLEKGMGPEAQKFHRTEAFKRQWIREDWIWHDFMEDLKSGKFEKKIAEISQAVGLPLRLVVQAGSAVNEDPKISSGLIDELDRSLIFSCTDGDIVLVHDELPADMRMMSKCTTVNDLTVFFENSKLDWHWIDFYLVCEIERNQYERIPETALHFVNSYRDLFEYAN